MTLNLNVQFNGSAINLLVSRGEATLGPRTLQRTCCCARPRCDGYSTATNYLRQRHFPSTFRETIARNSLEFPLTVALPQGRTFNTEYYRDNILAALTEFRSEDDGKKLVVHGDNARVHTA
jgi:hypothetical protein